MLSHGCEARSAASALLCIECVKAAPTDVVLIDLEVQKSDGIDSIRQLRAHPEIQDTLPIIALVASLTTEQTKQIQGAGASRFLHKPVQFENLLAEIRALVPQAAACSRRGKSA